jgi:hypothetical protein
MKKYVRLVLFLAVLLIAAGFGHAAQAQQTNAPHRVFLPLVQAAQAQPVTNSDQATLTLGNARITFGLTETDEEPGVLTFAPSTGQVGDTITVTGTHFTGVVLVLFGGIPAAFQVISDNQISTTVPAGVTSGVISVVTLAQSAALFTLGVPVTPTATLTPTATSPATATSVPTGTVPATSTPVPATATSVPTATPVATSTATPVVPTATPIVSAPAVGIWIGQAELAALPMSGAGWSELLSAANSSAGSPSLSNQDSNNNVLILAKALVFARTGTASYRTDVISALRAIATGNLESGARALALGRELAAYVIAADLVNLKTADPALDAQFRTKIKGLLTFSTGGGPGNLIECQEQRPNNWGRHCGASRIAVDMYLGDKTDLDRAAKVFHGWLGDRSAYTGFKYGDLSWQSNPSAPVGVNPVGATIQGHDVSGAQPDDMRRGGSFHWPPSATGYPWEALQGAVVQAHMLNRAGYPVWTWNDKAMLRAVQFLYNIGWPAEGDDRWQIHIINKAYSSHFPTTGGGAGKNMGWTQWTLQ